MDLLHTDAEAEAPIVWTPDGKSRLIGKDQMLGKSGGKRGREWQRLKWLDSTVDSMDRSLSKLRETVKERGDCHAAVHGVTKSRT